MEGFDIPSPPLDSLSPNPAFWNDKYEIRFLDDCIQRGPKLDFLGTIEQAWKSYDTPQGDRIYKRWSHFYGYGKMGCYGYKKDGALHVVRLLNINSPWDHNKEGGYNRYPKYMQIRCVKKVK